MWLSERLSGGGQAGARLMRGRVTIGGGAPAVDADGELRGVEIWSPVGLRWKPKSGTDVLVFKEDDAAIALASPDGTAADEVTLEAGGCKITLANGNITLESGGGIMLRCGSQFINITPSGIQSTMLPAGGGTI